MSLLLILSSTTRTDDVYHCRLVSAYQDKMVDSKYKVDQFDYADYITTFGEPSFPTFVQMLLARRKKLCWNVKARVLPSMSRLDPRSCWSQLSYAIKNQLGHPKPQLGDISCPKLVLYGIEAPHNRTFPCMEATYPLCHKLV